MEQENKDTFYKNVDEFGQKESFIGLRYYFRVIGDRAIKWNEDQIIPKKLKDGVECLAVKYLV